MTAQSILDSPPPAKEFERFDDTLMGLRPSQPVLLGAQDPLVP